MTPATRSDSHRLGLPLSKFCAWYALQHAVSPRFNATTVEVSRECQVSKTCNMNMTIKKNVRKQFWGSSWLKEMHCVIKLRAREWNGVFHEIWTHACTLTCPTEQRQPFLTSFMSPNHTFLLSNPSAPISNGFGLTFFHDPMHKLFPAFSNLSSEWVSPLTYQLQNQLRKPTLVSVPNRFTVQFFVWGFCEKSHGILCSILANFHSCAAAAYHSLNCGFSLVISGCMQAMVPMA